LLASPWKYRTLNGSSTSTPGGAYFWMMTCSTRRRIFTSRDVCSGKSSSPPSPAARRHRASPRSRSAAAPASASLSPTWRTALSSLEYLPVGEQNPSVFPWAETERSRSVGRSRGSPLPLGKGSGLITVKLLLVFILRRAERERTWTPSTGESETANSHAPRRRSRHLDPGELRWNAGATAVGGDSGAEERP